MVSKKRGFTILETVLVMGILSTLMLLVAAFFSKAQHYTKDAETYSRVQRQTNLALRRITDDLQLGSQAWTQWYGDSVIFLSSTPNSPTEPRLEFDPTTGKVIWKKWICYFYDAAGRQILRAEVPLDAPTGELFSSPAPDVDPAYFVSSSSQQAIARDVEEFFVEGTGHSFRIRVTCRASSPVPGRRPEDKIVEVTSSTEINLLN